MVQDTGDWNALTVEEKEMVKCLINTHYNNYSIMHKPTRDAFYERWGKIAKALGLNVDRIETSEICLLTYPVNPNFRFKS